LGSRFVPWIVIAVRFFPVVGVVVNDGGGTAGVTVSTAVPEMSPEVAVIVVAPVATARARPCDPELLETVAAPVTDDDHVTEWVRLAVLRLEYVPVALNCWVCPAEIVAVNGETLMLTSTAGATVRAAVPEMSPEVAVMVVAPVPTPVARPELETEAVPVTDDDHVTESVRSAVLRLEYVPVALNCWVCPAEIEAVNGETLMLTSTAGATVRAAVPEMSPEVAVMVVAPVPTPVARPELETVAVPVTDDDHVAELVRSAVLRLEYVPVAANCCV
jgi:hypothetical protein